MPTGWRRTASRIGDAGALALAESPHLTRLSRLVLFDNGIGTSAKETLRRRFGETFL
jgi:hypothetical protein